MEDNVKRIVFIDENGVKNTKEKVYKSKTSKQMEAFEKARLARLEKIQKRKNGELVNNFNLNEFKEDLISVVDDKFTDYSNEYINKLIEEKDVEILELEDKIQLLEVKVDKILKMINGVSNKNNSGDNDSISSNNSSKSSYHKLVDGGSNNSNGGSKNLCFRDAIAKKIFGERGGC